MSVSCVSVHEHISKRVTGYVGIVYLLGTPARAPEVSISCRELVFSEHIILEKLNKLNISKSPAPDGIHPRVLFELRYELLEPLNILFESSYKLGKLPDEWKLGRFTILWTEISDSLLIK